MFSTLLSVFRHWHVLVLTEEKKEWPELCPLAVHKALLWEAVQEPPSFLKWQFLSQVFEILANARAAGSGLEGTIVLKWLQFCEGVHLGCLRTSRPDCGMVGTSALSLVPFPDSVLFVQLALNLAKKIHFRSLSLLFGVLPSNQSDNDTKSIVMILNQ